MSYSYSIEKPRFTLNCLIFTCGAKRQARLREQILLGLGLGLGLGVAFSSIG